MNCSMLYRDYRISIIYNLFRFVLKNAPYYDLCEEKCLQCILKVTLKTVTGMHYNTISIHKYISYMESNL